MGTRGYIVYRYKKLFFCLYNHWDSYPSGLGLQLLHEIPRDPEAFREWLEDKQDELEAVLDKRKNQAQVCTANPTILSMRGRSQRQPDGSDYLISTTCAAAGRCYRGRSR